MVSPLSSESYSADNKNSPESELSDLITNKDCENLIRSLYRISIIGWRKSPEKYGDQKELELLKKYGLVSVMESDDKLKINGGIFLTELGETIYHQLLLKTNGINTISEN